MKVLQFRELNRRSNPKKPVDELDDRPVSSKVRKNPICYTVWFDLHL